MRQQNQYFTDQSAINTMPRQASEPTLGADYLFQDGSGFVICAPDEITVPFVFNSPHSGSHYSTQFIAQSCLSPRLLRKSEDALVDQIFSFVPDLGAPLMAATFPRAYVDVNREPFELDPKLINGPIPLNANEKSVRVAAGLGTIARVVGYGLEIYREPLSLEEVLWRIGHFYLPYHRRLRELIDFQNRSFETTLLIDCHSMPSHTLPRRSGVIPDIVIGDRYGASANPELISYIISLLKGRGLEVDLNTPYAGGYITEHYGRPSEGVHAIQIEINRSVYMDEVKLEPHSGFLELQSLLRDVFSNFVSEVSASLITVPDAAE